ncbi:hypothetical protein R6Z07F_009127 [Ovis aries]
MLWLGDLIKPSCATVTELHLCLVRITHCFMGTTGSFGWDLMASHGVELLCHVDSFVTSWTVAHQASLSMGFPRQEYLSGLPLPSPGDIPDSGIEPMSPALQVNSFNTEPPGKPTHIYTWSYHNAAFNGVTKSWTQLSD